ncbi:AraC family transcriptional regulator [Pilimelia anulata]|uniref:AraC family transcriptional regulator n=1 Tax=Pilimelia anulata TaxID=53371 RepID=A0A8J3B820_9ACTN|nr:AraC family transcriptional regulator [Pilimelia anulata]GGK00127.1 AraC family transcriptional regulator [Pilimelia anulata]
MDALSEVLAAAQVGRPVSALTVGRAPWAIRLDEPGAAQFHVLLQGSAWLTAAGAAPLRLDVGDVVLLPHGTAHTVGDDPHTAPADRIRLAERHPADSAGTSVRLGGAGAATAMLCGAYLLDRAVPPHPMLRALPAVMHIPASRGSHPGLRAAVDLLAAEVEQPRPGSTAIVGALVDAMLAYVLRSWCERHRDACPEWLAALADPAVGRALAAMHAEPARGWTVAGLAGVAGLSRAAFSRRFGALVGEPPLAYLTQWRMLRAQQLLRAGTATLDAVARQVGYDSPFAFGRAFKRYAGTSPGRYRAAGRPPG